MASFNVVNLTDSELRLKLAEFGHLDIPVTETTRKILNKKVNSLMTQANSLQSAKKSLTAFSSGDESGSDTGQNGGNRKSRRVSMPPPSGYKTRRGKASSPNYTPETSPVPSTSKVSCSTPFPQSRVAADFKAPRLKRFSSPAFSLKQPQYRAVSRPTAFSSYEFDSGSDSDVPDFKNLPLSTKRRTGLPYGSLSSYRSKLSYPNSNSFFGTRADSYSLGLRNDSKKDSKPFLSSFVGRFSRKSGINEAVNPLDIKESDVEEDGFAEKWRNVNFASRNFNFREWIKPFKSVFQHFKSKESTISSWNNSQLLSMLLLGLFVLFFIWLALAYFRVSQRAGIAGKSSNFYPVCHTSQEELTEKSCIQKEDLFYAVNLYKSVHMELQARGLRYLCGPSPKDGTTPKFYMSESEVVDFLLQSGQHNDMSKIMRGMKNLKLLILHNRHWMVSVIKDSVELMKSDFEDLVHGYALQDKAVLSKEIPSYLKENSKIYFVCQTLSVPWSCYLTRLFYKLFIMFVIVSCGILGLGLVRVAYLFLKSYQKIKKSENEAVMEMVQKIVDHVSDVAERANSGVDSNGSVSSSPQDFVAIRHVHDTLIPPAKRQEKARIWRKAVKFIEENESRIRTEVQQVWGEDTDVWRWVGPILNKTCEWVATSQADSDSETETNQLYPDLSGLKAEAKKNSDRVWQGEAFETSEGSMNSLPSSPTQCLKIRHMFKHDKDYGPDWLIKIRDAIVEKCEGAKIVHLSVIKHSKEGLVYIKCASLEDAGIAYRQLHGSWFDGALVTVKYVRLERYHERFPKSVYTRTPLRPSNNLKLSLQGTSSS